MSLLPELFRNAFASLLLAIGFAGLAQRPGCELSLLVELQRGWQRLRYSQMRLGRGSGPKAGNREYWRQLGEAAEAVQAESGGKS